MSPMTFNRFISALSVVALAGVELVNAQSDQWHFDEMEPLLLARLDGIRDPGEVSQHMHRILGGNNMAADYNFADARKCTCSTIYAQADCSNYWSPQVYWTEDINTAASNTYTTIPAHHRFYYKLGRNAWDIPVEPFPEGLRMLVGNANAKDQASQGIPDGMLSFTCQGKNFFQDSSDATVSKTWDFDSDCPTGLKTELHFPNCWDGHNLYLPGNTHMAYASQLIYGGCPMTHPIRIPMIMLENTWATSKVAPGKSIKDHLIFANGDTTGWAQHADFTNGWDMTVLRAALNDPTCVNLNHSIPATVCPSLQIGNGQAAENTCKSMRGDAPNEPGSVDLSTSTTLAGYNPPWSSGPHANCTGNCTLPDISAFLGVEDGPYVVDQLQVAAIVSQNLVTVSGDSTEAWQDLGCMDKTVMINQPSYVTWTDHDDMTVKACQNYCGQLGAPYAGLELGAYCHCTTTFNTSSFPVDGTCNNKCAGNDKELCGGVGFYTVQYSPLIASTGAVAPSSDPTYAGCWVGGTISTKSASEWKDVDSCRDFCKGYSYFGLENRYYCHCSNDLPALNGVNSLVGDIACNLPCSTNSQEICGGLYFQSVYLVSGKYSIDIVDKALGLNPETDNITPALKLDSTVQNNLVTNSSATCASPTWTVTLPASTETVKVNNVVKRASDNGCTTTVDGPVATVIALSDGRTVVERHNKRVGGVRRRKHRGNMA